jgi:hypothetical protein
MVAPGNMVVLANTSTPHPGSTSGNVTYVDATSPYPGSTSISNLGVFSTASIPYLGGVIPDFYSKTKYSSYA